MTNEERDLPVEIKGLMVDPSSNMPIVILREKDGQRLLPIWIGVFEANAIAQKIDGLEPQRPMTHDLIFNSYEALGAKVEKIVISDLQESTFFALIYLQTKAGELTIDARPSDAMALALRAEAPLFVRTSVLDQALAADRVTEVSDEEQLKKWLEELDPDELGKYTM